jgi:hypothetical protein
MARPSLYDPAYCERVIELGQGGASIVEMAHALGVVKQTLYDWEKAHPEFLDALTRAREASQVWWEVAGRVGLVADKFNASVWSRSMAARFPKDWREVKGTELTGADGGAIETLQRVERHVIDPRDSDSEGVQAAS